ncbi:MAG: hypothetical protein ACRBM6_22225 [Geminicoccales bacterium]
MAPDGRYSYCRIQLLRELDDDTLDTLVEKYVAHTVPEMFIILSSSAVRSPACQKTPPPLPARCRLVPAVRQRQGMDELGQVIRDLD